MAADLPAGCSLHPDVELARSSIAGRGLFATAPIAAGTPVVRLDGAATGGGADPGNHSCDPNLGWLDQHTLVAIRDIGAGEELTSDYATGSADPQFLLACHCETYRCRQLITGDDWQIPQLQQRYAGYWSPAVQRLIDAANVG